MPAAPTLRVLVIINPVAGHTDAGKIIESLKATLTAAAIDFTSVETRGAGDALEWAKSATGFDRVLVAGGDGTVMEALSGMIRNSEPVPVGILPQGTASLHCRSVPIAID